MTGREAIYVPNELFASTSAEADGGHSAGGCCWAAALLWGWASPAWVRQRRRSAHQRADVATRRTAQNLHVGATAWYVMAVSNTNPCRFV